MAFGDTIPLTPAKTDWDYSVYDKPLANWLVSVFLDAEGRSIPLVFSTPDRARAQVMKKFRTTTPQTIPLPMMSLSQTGDCVFDFERMFVPKARYRKLAISEDALTTYLVPPPRPYNLQYQLELWTRTRYEAMVCRRNLLLQFTEGDEIFLLVDLGAPWNSKIVPVKLSGVRDNSNLESGAEKRTLRWTFTFDVKGWLSIPVSESAFLVHSIHTAIETSNDVNASDDLQGDEVFYPRDDLVETWDPLVEGNPATGEVVVSPTEFSDPYEGKDHRLP